MLSQSLATTLLTTLEGFVAASIGGIALALLFNLSKWLEYSLFPYAVILQVTPVIAIAPLLLIYLPQQTAVDRLRLDRGIFPGAVEHHARAELGRPQPRRPVPALWRLALADAALPEIAGGAALYPRRPADRRRPVADRRGGGRNRRRHGRRGLGPRLQDRRIRLSPQHTPHVRGAAFAVAGRDCHLCPAGASFPPLVCGAGTRVRLERKTDGHR